MNKETFNKRMFNNIYSSNYYPIKRAFGKTLQSCDIDAVIAYTKLSDNKDTVEQNIEFLIAGLCYNVIKPNQERTTFVKFENVLSRLNRENEIENFLRLRYDNDGYFAKRFYTLSKKAINCLSSNEQFDYISLFSDLKHWNDGNSTKMKWAMSIVKYEDMEEN